MHSMMSSISCHIKSSCTSNKNPTTLADLTDGSWSCGMIFRSLQGCPGLELWMVPMNSLNVSNNKMTKMTQDPWRLPLQHLEIFWGYQNIYRIYLVGTTHVYRRDTQRQPETLRFAGSPDPALRWADWSLPRRHPWQRTELNWLNWQVIVVSDGIWL